ncbi:hypothetical protein ACTFIU_009674 [Dictyostelium citrinum]
MQDNTPQQFIISNMDSLEDIQSYITIDNIVTQFTLYPGVINTIGDDCSHSCNNNIGTCNSQTDLHVFIGNNECTPIYNISESEIIRNASVGTGLKSVRVVQNNLMVSIRDIYQYYSKDKQCPNHCTSTSNGICNSTTGYCSFYSITGSNSTIDKSTDYTNITKLETDFNGKKVNEHSLLNNWSIISNINKTVYTFIQSIQNNQCNIIIYTIEEIINNDRDISFEGIGFKLNRSVKMTVGVENYQYSIHYNYK